MNPKGHVGILKQGVDVWNNWRDEHPRISPYLNEVPSTPSVEGLVRWRPGLIPSPLMWC